MNEQVLSKFYNIEGNKRYFIKPFFIRLLRNKIIDPNTMNFLNDGFSFINYKTEEHTVVPCDDANWNEYMTFKMGFENNVLEYPFSMKLHNNTFFQIENYSDFEYVFNMIIEFRTKTIKKGWAIKYGLEYEGVKYPMLEDLSEIELINWVDPRAHARYRLNDLTMQIFEE